MPPIRHLLLDCDGVLVDSEPIAVEVEVALLREAGLPADAAMVEQHFVGKDLAAMIEIVRDAFGVTLPESFKAEHGRRTLAAFAGRLQAVRGLPEALDTIPLRKSVVSNSVRERVLYAIATAGIAHHFGDRVHAAGDPDLRPKPWPDLYLAAAAKAEVDIAHCLVVEDSPSGVRAGVAAGARVLGFTGTAHDPVVHSAKLMAAGAERTESDMARLPWWIEAFASGFSPPR
jgi:HAD superfamily hydrolase (TIGR01509 family)